MSGGDWVISGIGMVSAGGDSPEALHRALCDATPLPRAAALDTPEPPFPSIPIADFNVKEYIERRGLKDLSRTSQLACAAASALAPGLEQEGPADVGVVLGTGWGSLRPVVDFEWEACTNPPRFLDPLLFAETVSNVPAGQIAILNGWSGFSLTVSCGPASGLEAIREAVVLLEEGRTPMAIAGGADELNLPALRVLSADGLLAASPESLPFGRDRSGIVGGEGACLLLIESAEHARGAGRRPLGRLRAAVGRFAGDPTTRGNAAAGDLADLLRALLEAGGIRAEEVDLVVVSADGSDRGDRDEAAAVNDVFGSGAAVLSPKAIVGETWGAAGSLATAVALECMRQETVPGRAKALDLDPGLPQLDLPAEALRGSVRHAVVLARGGTGHLSAVLLSAPEESDGA